MAIAATRQTGQHAVVPPPAAMLLDDCDVEELEEIEEDRDRRERLQARAARRERSATPTSTWASPTASRAPSTRRIARSRASTRWW
jgi:chromatin segregation and condensation protein Rec8/ScpA/Scc1 (kleisin family)